MGRSSIRDRGRRPRRQPADAKAHSTLSSPLGPIKVSTAPLDDTHVAVDAAVPTVNGGELILRSVRDRKMSQIAGETATRIFVLTLLGTLVLIAGVTALIRRAIHQQVGPLRRTTEAIVASGNHSLRIGRSGNGEIGALAATIDTMLDTLAAKDAALRTEQAEREEQLRHTYEEQDRLQAQVRQSARQAVKETSATVIDRLTDVASLP